jgi:DNA-directed RNA polymerase subunit N (RpoN/RPB10)
MALHDFHFYLNGGHVLTIEKCGKNWMEWYENYKKEEKTEGEIAFKDGNEMFCIHRANISYIKITEHNTTNEEREQQNTTHNTGE